MALTVHDVLELKPLKEFRLAAGEGGLGRFVKRCSILDYEYDEAVKDLDEGPFSQHNFVIGSLLFAKNDASKILKAVQKLYQDGVSALAVKTVLFKELPDEVLRFADEKNFPLFLFDTSFFEDVIAQLHIAIHDEHVSEHATELLDRLAAEKMLPEKVAQFSGELHPTLKKWIQTYQCSIAERMDNQAIQRAFHSFEHHPQREKDTALFYFRHGFVFLVSSDERNEASFTRRFQKAVEYAGLSEQLLRVGNGRPYEAEHLDRGLLEAIQANEGAQLIGKAALDFARLGSLRLLLSAEITPAMRSFSEDYLHPLQKESDGRLDLMQTAAAYVKTNGSIRQTAQILYIHENSVRYRIGRIRELMDEQNGEYVFFQNLAAAVWIHLIQKQRRDQ